MWLGQVDQSIPLDIGLSHSIKICHRRVTKFKESRAYFAFARLAMKNLFCDFFEVEFVAICRLGNPRGTLGAAITGFFSGWQ